MTRSSAMAWRGARRSSKSHFTRWTPSSGECAKSSIAENPRLLRTINETLEDLGYSVSAPGVRTAARTSATAARPPRPPWRALGDERHIVVGPRREASSLSRRSAWLYWTARVPEGVLLCAWLRVEHSPTGAARP